MQFENKIHLTDYQIPTYHMFFIGPLFNVILFTYAQNGLDNADARNCDAEVNQIQQSLKTTIKSG